MRRTAFAAAAALCLFAVAGCSTLQTITQGIGVAAGFQVTQDQHDTVRAGYIAGVLAWASGYRDLYDANPCRAGTHATLTNICAEYPVVQQLQQTHQVVDAQLRATQAGLNACNADPNSSGCKGLSAAYQALTATIASAKAIARVYGYGGS